ncbi:10740_t:CDS:2 [Paraglomus brasilianum]|uniref:Ethylmalonyl-CoA decarboxylase n=1 Tax=Paraglomus brasilianum TaxID=144538 RepID=A0A9N9FE42_9GLOM|nr:10740_t:CDS:2 [Paraglomus brasilianum]
MAQLADAVDKLQSIIEGKVESEEESALVAVILTGSGNKSFCYVWSYKMWLFYEFTHISTTPFPLPHSRLLQTNSLNLLQSHMMTIAGLDLNIAKDHINDSTSAAKMGSVMQDTLLRFFRLPLVSVAAIEGYALGGGAELTTSCDYRILSHSAVVRFVATSTVWGGGARLAGIVGRAKALKLLATSGEIAGQSALDMGFANTLSESGESVSKSVEFLDPFVYFQGPMEGEHGSVRKRNSVKAVRSMKSLIASASMDPLGVVKQVEFDLFCGLWGSGENKEILEEYKRRRVKE